MNILAIIFEKFYRKIQSVIEYMRFYLKRIRYSKICQKYDLLHKGKHVIQNGFTVVIPLYSRIHHLDGILQSLIVSRSVAKIIVSNSNLSFKLSEKCHTRHSKLVFIDEPKKFGVGIRLVRAMESHATYYLSIDDDQFLTPQSIDALYSKLLENPGKPIGVKGGVLFEKNFHTTQPNKDTKIFPVTCLYGVYAFTHKHLEKAFRIAEENNIKISELNNGEDLLISLSGLDWPIVILANMFQPPDWNADFALHKSIKDFASDRYEIFKKILRSSAKKEFNDNF